MAQLLRYRPVKPLALRTPAFNLFWKGVNEQPSEDGVRAAMELSLVDKGEFEKVHIVLSRYFRIRVCNTAGHGIILDHKGQMPLVVVEVNRTANAPSVQWVRALDLVQEYVNLQLSPHGLILLLAGSYVQICGFIYNQDRATIETEAFTDMVNLQRAPAVDCMGFGEEERHLKVARLLGGVLKYIKLCEEEEKNLHTGLPSSLPYPLRKARDVEELSSSLVAEGSLAYRYTDEHGETRFIVFIPTGRGLEWPQQSEAVALEDEFIAGYWMRRLEKLQ